MNRLFVTISIATISFFTAAAQDATTLMAEGLKYEQQLKDTQAIVKYTDAFKMQPSNIKAALKAAEMNISIGLRQPSPEGKARYYQEAKSLTEAALQLSPENAAANYTMAVVYDKLATTEVKNDKFGEAVRNTKIYADKALLIDTTLGKAWYIIGKWHTDIINMNPVKKAAVKVLYGGMPKSNLDDAIRSYEKCKQLEPYYAPNYLGLAAAYRTAKQYEKSLAALQQCVKCPTMSPADKVVKEEAKKLIVDWQ